MICVLSLFGEVDLQNTLRKVFQSNDIYFIEDNCTTSVQLTTQVEDRCREVDAVIIYGQAMNMDILKEYVEELRSFTEYLRIVLILNGDCDAFLRTQINEYRDMKLDLVFEDDGFDSNELVEILRKGKLSAKDFKVKRKESGFSGDIDDNPLPEDLAKHPKDERKLFKIPEKKEKSSPFEEQSEYKSFGEPQGHFTIGVFNAARGAGATWTAGNVARYLAMHNYKTCIADMSSTGAVGMMKLKNIDIYDDFDIEELKSKYNVTVSDFGTPIEIAPNGENFKLMSQYKPETIQCFTNCDIKLIMGFSDPWNIQKINFFFINDTWRNLFDNSYLFIIAGNLDNVKKLYSDGNFFGREDDYREHILEALRKDELK